MNGVHELTDRSGEIVAETDPGTGTRMHTRLIRPMRMNELALDSPRVELLGALAALRYPHIPRFLAAGIRWSHLTISTEAAEGMTTRTLLHRDPMLEGSRALAWLEPAAWTVSYAMEHGIYHTRFNLDSIVVTPKGEVKVVGFGEEQLRIGRAPSINDRAACDDTHKAFERVVVDLLTGPVREETKE